jgi:hypothetical protein
MADLTITASAVVPAATASLGRGTAGATITQGQTLYLDSTTLTYMLADADDSSATATVAGVAINAASSGQPVDFIVSGSLTLAVTSGNLTAGEIYVLSGTAGGIAVEGDLASDDYVSIIGVGTSTTTMAISFNNSGVQVP